MGESRFVHEVRIGLGRSDAAGVIYFTEALDLAHEAAEAYLESVGVPLQSLLAAGSMRLPVVHAEVDFSTPVRPGDCVALHLSALHAGHSSVTFEWTAKAASGTEAFRTRIVHACLDPATGRSAPLPQGIRESLTGGR